jgi:Domain of unknown function (DUF4253)
MAINSLPPDGELRIGSVILADGRRILSDYGSYEPMAWVTTQPVPDAGMVWSDLSDVHDQTGLVPFLLAGLPGAPERPWDTRDFAEPADVAWLGHMDAAELLEERWDDQMPSEYEDQDDDELTAMRAPFSRQFPGLAPAEVQHLSQEQRQQVLSALPPARIGLVVARRPADVLPLVGLPMTDQFDNALPVAAVLRSWEDRFGAKLLQVGFADIWLLAERPPHIVEDAQLLAAEIFAFCDEYGGNGLHDIPRITAALMSSPIWTFWWD